MCEKLCCSEPAELARRTSCIRFCTFESFVNTSHCLNNLIFSSFKSNVTTKPALNFNFPCSRLDFAAEKKVSYMLGIALARQNVVNENDNKRFEKS